MRGRDDVPAISGIENLEFVGRGGFAVVYRGHQPAFGRDVAVKVLLRSELDADDRRRFERECRAMGALSDHPGIVTLYDAGITDDGRPYLVMAYVAGGTLADRLAGRGALTWQEATTLGVRLAGALETAHRAEVLHRDIKPANVLRARYSDQLSDFGIARIAGGHETRTGQITASVAHAAPEILDGRPPTAQADVYGLASTVYETLTGHAAFARDTDEGLLPLIRRVVTEDPPDLRQHGVPDEVARVIETAMAKDPSERHATAREFGLALRGAQAVLGIPVTDLVIVGGDERTVPPGRPGAATHDTPATPPPPSTGPATPPPPPGSATPPDDATADLGAAAPPDDASPGDDSPGGTTGIDDRSPSTAKKIALGAGVAAALLALVIGLVVIVGDDPSEPPPGSAVAPTVPGDTSTAEQPDGSASNPGSSPPGTAVDATPDAGRRLGIVAPAVADSHPIYSGVERAAAELGLPVSRADPGGSQDGQIFDQIAAGQNTIVVLAPDPFRQGSVDAVLASADAHPDVEYIVIGAEVSAPNVASYVFADHEGSFLVGAAAALASNTGRVGFLGGVDTEEIRRYEAGFVAGVRHASPTTQVDVRYLPETVSGFDDTGAAAALATEIYDAGADVVFHAGTTGDGLFEAAAAAGAWAIGVDTDQALTAAPEVGSSILTSMVRPYDTVGYDAVVAAASGTLSPGVNTVGIDAGVGWTTTGGHIDAIVPDLMLLADDVIGGLTPVPSTVEMRALAPVGSSCPAEGCQVRILEAHNAGEELVLNLEANWMMDIAGMHAHYFWSPRYTPEQVGADSAERFGVAVGDWDLDDSYPQYTTQGAVSLANAGDDTEICVTAADAGHNVLDPRLFSCTTIFVSVD